MVSAASGIGLARLIQEDELHEAHHFGSAVRSHRDHPGVGPEQIIERIARPAPIESLS